MFEVNLLNETHAYFYGLLLSDGHLELATRNRGRISIELANGCEVLNSLQEYFGGSRFSRSRKTNFSDNLKIEGWRNSRIEFRSQLMKFGFPPGDKSLTQNVPNSLYNKRGFWRGYIDGNGSMGFTENNRPFLSIATKSSSIAHMWEKFLFNFHIQRNTNRNKRDNFYNILITTEDAQNVLNYLYNNAEVKMDYNYQNYKNIMNWIRPPNMPKAPPSKQWDHYQDRFILNHSIQESIDKLDRTKSSIKNRLFRLKHKAN